MTEWSHSVQWTIMNKCSGCEYAHAVGKAFCCVKCEQGKDHRKKCKRLAMDIVYKLEW
jgi:hypothetical protein